MRRAGWCEEPGGRREAKYRVGARVSIKRKQQCRYKSMFFPGSKDGGSSDSGSELGIDVAAEEGENQASWSFNIANEVEKIHAGLYQRAAEALAAGGDMKAVDYYVCKVCGNTVEGAPTEKCPICNAGPNAFFKVE